MVGLAAKEEEAVVDTLVSCLSTFPALGHFFTQTELIEPALSQAAQLGIHFFFHNTQLEMHLLEGPDKGHSTGEGK